MKKEMEASVIHAESNTAYVIKGIVIAFLFTLISLLLFAAVLTYTEIGENTIPPVIITLSGISILMGASISTIKIKKHGLLNGTIIGGVYIITLYLVSSIIHTGFEVNSYTVIMIIASILAGIIGGVVGVNIK